MLILGIYGVLYDEFICYGCCIWFIGGYCPIANIDIKWFIRFPMLHFRVILLRVCFTVFWLIAGLDVN